MNRPHIVPALVSEWIEHLAPRFRGQLEAQPRLADSWAWTCTDGCWRIATPSETVTLSPVDGVIAAAHQVSCSCLLYPKCLHLAAVLVALPVFDGPLDEVIPSAQPAATLPQQVAPESFALTPKQRQAVLGAGRAATGMLRAGVGAFGLVLEGELLRAAHSCRIAGLHRLAAALVRLVERGRQYRDQRPQFRLEALAGDLHDVLTTVWRLREGEATERLVGTARRAYRPAGSMRLTGLFTEAIVSAGGYAGVVTYLCDPDGRLWSVADVTPGEAIRCQVAYHSPVLLGDVGLSHAALCRAGVRLQGMTASADRRLGSGREVRAVHAEGAAFSDPPLKALWDLPFGQQLDQVWQSRELELQARPAGSDLLFVRARVVGVESSVLVVEVEHGPRVACGPPSDHAELAYVDNLRLLGACPGLAVRLIGRVRAGMPRALQLLAIGADSADSGLVLPADWWGRVNLGLDRLQRGYLPGAGPRPTVLRRADEDTPVIDPLDIVRRRVLQVAAGGSATVAQPAWSGLEADERSLERAQLRTAAALLRALRFAVAQGSTPDTVADPIARAWMALREYERHASARLERLRWD